MSFPAYFVQVNLSSSGWPRRVGILRRVVVDRLTLESVYMDMLRRAMTIGAGMPPLAVQLVADSFRDRDWKSEPAAELLVKLQVTPGMAYSDSMLTLRQVIEANPDEMPWNLVLGTRLAEDPVPIALLQSNVFLGLLHWNFCASLLWGLSHPKMVVRALRRDRAESLAVLPGAKAHGLNLPSDYVPPTPRDVLEESVELVRTFEATVRPLSSVPAELASHPRIVKYLARPDAF